ncbi:hypothetical protein ACFQ3P_03130 [Paraburkholderia sabiae]|jgi:hypothetical protein|uniref:Uncharacterized protein n=1 Tax=Paraburkholderia sabiae TaxID=273251 RepID=A0ABU9Q714_9BURK|nr:hypothetical protein [Paraburkholderia sabiae]WJZ78861.1 hypothetical protein QEN71_33340 [Paraburkholderia sabiae]CAD6512974.1 hypothetical protein LMG24235_00628 [Paraburkholderia sabiae]
MNAICPLHGPTTVVRTNAYGFPVYACCCNDVADPTPPDACTRAPTQRGAERQPLPQERKTTRE